MGVGKTFKLTVQERILIHLHDFSRYVENIEVPFALTQEGVANSVGVVRSAIPRAIKKLISKNQVKEVLAHVHNVSRRRKVYYLTTEGLKAAMEIKEKLATIDITVVDADNNKISCKIKEVPNKLGRELSILTIILNLDSDTTFNEIEFDQKKGKKDLNLTAQARSMYAGKKGMMVDSEVYSSDLEGVADVERAIDISEKHDYINKAPKISYFVGRKAELETINNLVTDSTRKIIIVTGMAGIGKTTLAVKLLETFGEHYNLFWYRFHEWDNLRNVLLPLSKFLELFNRTKLKEYLASNQNLDLNEVGDILEMELKDIGSLIFLDDFHKINETLMNLFILLREILERISGVQLLIFSRSFVPFYDRRDVLVKNMITELELAGLNEKDSKELLEKRNIKLENFHRFYELTKGHPLSLELLDPDLEITKQKNIMLYLEEEVLAKLSLREKTLLKIASVFRYPVPADGFFIYEKAQINRETLSLLNRKALIKELSLGFEIHDLIRDFFYSYLTTEEKISYHKRIGNFYMGQLKMINDVLKKKISNVLRPQILPRQGRPSADKRTISTGAVDVEQLLEQRARGILEAQFHFLMAKDYNRATEVAVILGKDLLNLNYVDEFLKNLDKIELSNISDEYNMDLQILKGDAQHVLGNLNHAIDLYNEALAIAENEGNKPKLAELYCKLGSINEKLNEYKVAIEYLNKSLEISKTMGDAKSLSDAYGSLGDVYWKLSEFDKSNDFYSRCLESAETMTDLPGKAKIFLSLGIQSAKHGQFEESLKHYERCLDILEKGKGLDGMNYGQFYESLGDHYLKTIFSYFIQENGKGK